MPPDYSIIIPAYNEAEVLPATLDAVRDAMAADARTGELIVVDNNSTDTTAEIARQHGATVVFESHNQISRARNTGGRAATGRIFLFLDADTTLDPELLAAALDAMDTGDYVGGGAVVRFDREVSRPAALVLGMWNIYTRVFKEAAGCCLFCTREAFEAVEGFSERVYASEEIWFAKAIKRWAKPTGQRFLILTDTPVTTSGRKADHPWRTAATLAVVVLFPPAVFFRGLCGYWYQRSSPVSPGGG